MGAANGNNNTEEATRGMIMAARSGGYFIATDAGARMEYQDGQNLYCDSNSINASVAITVDSDRRIKTNIGESMERYEGFFMSLRPCYYRLIRGPEGRYHTGFIAQEVEQALVSAGLTTQDFAGLAKRDRGKDQGSDDPLYGLGYSEFIALNTYMIQKLYQRIAALETAINE